MTHDTQHKVSDIPDREILEICAQRHIKPHASETPDIALADTYPVKVIMAKMEKLDKRGFLEWGVILRTAWPSEEGYEYLEHLRAETV